MSGEYGPDMEAIAIEEDFKKHLSEREFSIWQDMKSKHEEEPGNAKIHNQEESRLMSNFTWFLRGKKD